MLTLTREQIVQERSCRRILGFDFFPGDIEESIAAMRKGGLLVAPSAPGLLYLKNNLAYREALQQADVCLADSGFMIMIWNWALGGSLTRISGLAYLRRLLEEPDVREAGNTFWVMSSQKSADMNREWLEKNHAAVPEQSYCVAPDYEASVEDPLLVQKLNQLRPKHVIITLGGGTQEPLGLYLKQNLDYQPAIYCIGAAIAFLSGDQVKIPAWADRHYLGWAFRWKSRPIFYGKRYWKAFQLFPMMLRYGSELPPLAR